jgi:hypothetical protein
MKGKILNYYGGGNTAKGFVNFYSSILSKSNNIYVLKGCSDRYNTKLLKVIGNSYLAKGYDIEVINSTIDIEAIEGILIPKEEIAIVIEKVIDGASLKSKDITIEYLELDKAFDLKKIEDKKAIIESINNNILKKFEESHNYFSRALKIHDEWEKIYIANMDFKKADILTEKIINNLLGKAKDKNTDKSFTVDRYLGGSTPIGPHDYVPNITEGTKRYFIKGRPGTGKSTILKKLAKKAKEKGYDVEVYHCGFDPNSLDMVVVRELGFTIFDSTAPHEYFPSKDSDEIIDVYEKFITPGTDEKYEEELNDIVKRYKEQVGNGVKALEKAKILKDQIEDIYEEAFDEVQGDKLIEEIKVKLNL